MTLVDPLCQQGNANHADPDGPRCNCKMILQEASSTRGGHAEAHIVARTHGTLAAHGNVEYVNCTLCQEGNISSRYACATQARRVSALLDAMERSRQQAAQMKLAKAYAAVRCKQQHHQLLTEWHQCGHPSCLRETQHLRLPEPGTLPGDRGTRQSRH